MSTEEIELEGLDYFHKFKERLDIAMAYINDGRDISDEDYLVLEQIFRVQKEGRLPFYKTVCTDETHTVTQIDLFTANPSCT